MVYIGGRSGIHNWCDILSVATDEVFACGLAPVCDWGNGLFLFRSVVWVYFGFVKGALESLENKGENVYFPFTFMF